MRKNPTTRAMAPSIGVNLRVTGHCNQGGRKYMEDAFAVAYQQTDDEKDLEYAYFGIFDGHGGREAAVFAKEHLMDFIVNQKHFWSDKDELVLKAIKDGFIATHMAMWKEVSKWPQTVCGLPSTSGSTVSVAFIRRGKIYLGHVGDSAIVLGYKEHGAEHYSARPLTRDHKPESPKERKRIEDVGGRVMSKSGVQRVVWNRPQLGHKGPVRRSTPIDQIPFLAVARSLGDLWSYDYLHGQFVISPEPDVSVVTIDPKRDRCIILATDGLWNMISPREAARIVEAAERENERHFLEDESRPIGCKPWVNPSKLLVEQALEMWYNCKKRADNTSVVTVMLDPPGPPRSEVLLRRRMMQKLRPREDSTIPPPVPEGDRREPRVLITHASPRRSEPPVPLERSDAFHVFLQNQCEMAALKLRMAFAVLQDDQMKDRTGGAAAAVTKPVDEVQPEMPHLASEAQGQGVPDHDPVPPLLPSKSAKAGHEPCKRLVVPTPLAGQAHPRRSAPYGVPTSWSHRPVSRSQPSSRTCLPATTVKREHSTVASTVPSSKQVAESQETDLIQAKPPLDPKVHDRRSWRPPPTHHGRTSQQQQPPPVPPRHTERPSGQALASPKRKRTDTTGGRVVVAPKYAKPHYRSQSWSPANVGLYAGGGNSWVASRTQRTRSRVRFQKVSRLAN